MRNFVKQLTKQQFSNSKEKIPNKYGIFALFDKEKLYRIGIATNKTRLKGRISLLQDNKRWSTVLWCEINGKRKPKDKDVEKIVNKILRYKMMFIALLVTQQLFSQSYGIGTGCDLSNNSQGRFSWQRKVASSPVDVSGEQSYVTTYTFYLPGAGNAQIGIVHSITPNTIAYEIYIDDNEIGSGEFSLDDFENVNGCLIIKGDGIFQGYFKLEIQYLSSKKQSVRILKITSYDYYSMLFNIEK